MFFFQGAEGKRTLAPLAKGYLTRSSSHKELVFFRRRRTFHRAGYAR